MSRFESIVALAFVGAVAVLAWQVRETRHELITLAAWREAPPASVPAPPQPPPAGRLDAEYVLEAPDIVELTFAAGTEPGVVKRLGGKKIISPDGTIALEPLDRLAVAGATLGQAEERVRRHLGVLGVTLKVSSYNSKCYYIVTDSGSTGERVVTLPYAEGQTVLDAVTASSPSQGPLAGGTRIWVARRRANEEDQILPVDYAAITRSGEARTNYSLLNGDRVYVKSVK